MKQPTDILVTAATGKTGSVLGSLLAQTGADAAGMTSRDPEKVTGSPLPLVHGDLRRPDSLKSAFEGVRKLYLVTPLGPDETEVGLNAIEIARAAGVEKIVYIAIHNLEDMREIPHFETKIPIKATLMNTGNDVVLGPNFFMQNDLMMLPAITGPGVYPMPVGSAGVWSIDARDIGQAAFNALTRDDWDGQFVPLCGPEQMTGTAIAEAWSRAIGRPVVYGGDDVEAWLAQMKAFLPPDPWIENDFRTMMEVTQAKGCPAAPQDRAATDTILGRAAASYSDFIAHALSRASSSVEMQQ